MILIILYTILLFFHFGKKYNDSIFSVDQDKTRLLATTHFDLLLSPGLNDIKVPGPKFQSSVLGLEFLILEQNP